MKIILIIIVFLATIGVVVYTYYGGFKSIKIHITQQGGEFVVFDSIKGDYRQSGVVMDKIYYSLLNDYQTETYKGYGKYFDNPKKTEVSKLRSEAGCIIEPSDVEKIKTLGAFKTKTLPIQQFIVTEFPFKGKMSVFFSIMRVYPALINYAKLNGYEEDGAVIEIIDVPNKKIYYRKEMFQKNKTN